MSKGKELKPEKMQSNDPFGHRYESIRLAEDINKMGSFEEFEQFYENELMDERLLMGRTLYWLLDQYNISPSKASRDIGKDESYLRKIGNGQELNPARDILLAVCVLIGATVDETQLLLKHSGKQPLYARRKRDAIIWFALKKRPLRKGIDGKAYLQDLNDYLTNHGYASLSKLISKK